MTLNLSLAQMSDLFFNYEHPAREELYKKYAATQDAPTPEELHEAALTDAHEFITAYDVPMTALELAADFENRV